MVAQTTVKTVVDSVRVVPHLRRQTSGRVGLNQNGSRHQKGGQIEADVSVHAMTEYWKSQGRYWCNYCKIFVADNKIAALKQYAGDLARVGGLPAPPAKGVNTSGAGSSSSSSNVPLSGQTRKRAVSPARPVAKMTRVVVSAEEAAVPAPLPEGAEIGAPGPWMPVEPARPSSSSSSSRERRLAQPRGERGEATIGSSAANDAVLGAEEDENEEGVSEDPEDLRNFRLVAKEYPAGAVSTTHDDAASDNDSKADAESTVFKKRKTAAGGGRGRPRNIRRK
ncbi:hypothetical protein THASP1DRAFT_21908 [Thamnocephalis sphaerospora]|uniref:Uncharacterized protein n=1 Tax=Thamnocephalis sphaerospora TaxID=78915 RepID=A0A4V1IXA3_9FUNG|nr:hypothetical protein THASP1DRAFT_21908 [Thamnocephalis sphaerospora]|eukprot:RKP10359.1 hypothetical protein THASP1DRAFT_21908 [Thamnocephalis sphaerospora]